MSLRLIRKYARPMSAIVLVAIPSLALAAYVLSQQRVTNPFADRYTIRVAFSQSAGTIGGLGLPVNVAGVRVGDINGVKLDGGQSVVTVQIDPRQLPRVYANATAQLRPRTPLKDMQIELYPGGPPAAALKPGGVIPVGQTDPQIDSDGLLNALDSDTRLWFRGLVSALDRGTRGRGGDLRAVLKTLGPTAAQFRVLGDAVAARRDQLARLVHNLAVLTSSTAPQDRQLAQVVDAGNATLRALAGQDAALRQSIAQLPGTLAATRSTLGHIQTFSNQLTPTLTALLPGVRRLPGTLRKTGDLAALAEPVLRKQVRPLVRDLQPLARDLGPTAVDLNRTAPDLIDTFKVLTYVVNELGYNPPGSDEGLLFWTAWGVHNLNSFMSTEDANGAVVRGLAFFSCDNVNTHPELKPVLGLLFSSVTNC